MITLSERLKTKDYQAFVLDNIVGKLRRVGNWGKRGLFAKIANTTGFSAAYVGQVLTGKKPLTVDFVCKIADYLGGHVDDFWGRADDGEELVDLVGLRMSYHSSPKTLDDYVYFAKRYGVYTTEERVKEILPEAEQSCLKTQAQDAELNIAINTLLAPFEGDMISYEDGNLPALKRLLQIIWESEVIRHLVEALIQIPEGKRREAVEILRREGIIPATKDASSSCSVFDIALPSEENTTPPPPNQKN